MRQSRNPRHDPAPSVENEKGDPQCGCGQICIDDGPAAPLGWCLCCVDWATKWSRNQRSKMTWDEEMDDWGDWQWDGEPAIGRRVIYPTTQINVREARP